MDFTLSEERRMLLETTDRYIRDRYPIETRQANVQREEGFNRDTWKELADLGLVGALLPPEAGGFGGAGEDLAVVFEALARGAVVEPFLASGVLGAWPLARAGGHTSVLEQVIAGEALIAFAHGEPQGRYGPSYVAATAASNGEGGWSWTINGRKTVVLNGDTADWLIVSARVSGHTDEEEGLSLFLVPAGMAERRGYDSVEGGRAAEVILSDVRLPAENLLGESGAAYPLIEETLARGALALSAEALGLMEVCKDMTLEYLKTRKQFGRPLGAFQALQHRMVDMALEIEQARSSVMLAAGRLEGERIERERTVSAAKHLAGRVGRLVAEEAIQLHGGVAMTWEYALAHFAKRLVMIDHLLGDEDHHLQRFMAFSRMQEASS
ncbi:MAG: acyl-CoA dehydrogenase family protein [Rhodobacteraceae bacterium]|nr:acyl-CoA dehydrogenase family protein [Paracoccaceae bacterium]